MINPDTREALANLLAERVGNNTLVEVIQDLADLGVLDDRLALRAILKYEYTKRLMRNEQSCNAIKRDLEVEYDVSLSHINNIIYAKTA